MEIVMVMMVITSVNALETSKGFLKIPVSQYSFHTKIFSCSVLYVMTLGVRSEITFYRVIKP
jgi:hypothetical protein